MKSLLEKTYGKDWMFCYDRNMTYQKTRFFNVAYTTSLARLFNIELTSWLCTFKDGLASEYYLENEYNTLIDAMQTRLQNGGVSILRKLTTYIGKPFYTFDGFVSKMPEDYVMYSKARLLLAFRRYIKAEHSVTLPNWLVFEPFEKALVKIVSEFLQSEVGTQKASTYMKWLSESSLPISLDVYRKDLCKYVVLGKRRSTFNTLLRRYRHVSMFDVQNEPLSAVQLAKDIEQISYKQAVKFLKEFDDRFYRRKLQHMQILRLVRNNSKGVALIRLYLAYVNFKEWKNFYRQKSSLKLKVLLQAIAHKTGYSLTQIAFCTEEEISSLLKNKKIVEVSELDARRANSIFSYTNRVLTIDTNPVSVSHFYLLRESHSSQEAITGTCVLKGKRKGVVVIINSIDDIVKVRKGNILVASTTRAEYIEAMHKAAAFVTNEGGMLSHAAILARELKKPCVIGTKVATKVLKDGDYVEVDATKGVVRILKRAKHIQK